MGIGSGSGNGTGTTSGSGSGLNGGVTSGSVPGCGSGSGLGPGRGTGGVVEDGGLQLLFDCFMSIGCLTGMLRLIIRHNVRREGRTGECALEAGLAEFTIAVK